MASSAPRPLPVVLARLRMPLMWAAMAALLAGYLGLSWWVGGTLLVVALAVHLRLGTPTCAPRVLTPPVRGRWMPLTSPVDAVPSQGTHAYGQTHALGLVVEDGTRPDIGWRPLSRPPEDFPAFGAAVYAPAEGTVVRVHDRQRDHRSRNSWPWLLGTVVENTLRELRGPSGLIGNHVVIDIGGAHVLLGHLRRGSVTVAPGERVAPGQPIAACGSSGACTEPQVRIQLMDLAHPLFAAGLPMVWGRGWKVGDPGFEGLPETWRPVEVTGPDHVCAGQVGVAAEYPELR